MSLTSVLRVATIALVGPLALTSCSEPVGIAENAQPSQREERIQGLTLWSYESPALRGPNVQTLSATDGTTWYLEHAQRWITDGGADTVRLTEHQADVLAAEFAGFGVTDSLGVLIETSPEPPPELECWEGGYCADLRSPAGASQAAVLFAEEVPRGRRLPVVTIRRVTGSNLPERGRPRFDNSRTKAELATRLSELMPTLMGGGNPCYQISLAMYGAREQVEQNRVTLFGVLWYLWDNKEWYVSGGLLGFALPSMTWTAANAVAHANASYSNRLALHLLAFMYTENQCWDHDWNVPGGGGWTYQCTEELTEIYVDGELWWSGYALHCEWIAMQ